MVALPQAAERGTTVSNPQEPNGRDGTQRSGSEYGQNPPPVPPGPGYPQRTGLHRSGNSRRRPLVPKASTPGSVCAGPVSTGQNPYPPGQYPPGQYGQQFPPPAKSRKVLWIVPGIVAGVIVLAVVGIHGAGERGGRRDVEGEVFG